jgi:hypothetical protein
VTSALAYYDSELIVGFKRFNNTGANVVKTLILTLELEYLFLTLECARKAGVLVPDKL